MHLNSQGYHLQLIRSRNESKNRRHRRYADDDNDVGPEEEDLAIFDVNIVVKTVEATKKGCRRLTPTQDSETACAHLSCIHIVERIPQDTFKITQDRSYISSDARM